jgi:hypothetical protein
MGWNVGTQTSDPSIEGGTLAITRGAQIFVNGTASNPVIMTSQKDKATWAAGNAKTGVWREGANEWGNLTIMGSAYVSVTNCKVATNTAGSERANYGLMEGLTPVEPDRHEDPLRRRNDNDDSGSITYLSIRYGGKVVGLANELNGLSLGGVGRNTELSYIEIMNNVDDGIEIFGGTCNVDHFSIWNIGDDAFDVDQGWRGKAQFGLIVQGYSVNAAQGSGVGDNHFEVDGAENSDYQPVTTSTIYNCTVIGQPLANCRRPRPGVPRQRARAVPQLHLHGPRRTARQLRQRRRRRGLRQQRLRLQRHAHLAEHLDDGLHRQRRPSTRSARRLKSPPPTRFRPRAT